MRKDGRWWMLLAVVVLGAGTMPLSASAATFGAEVFGAYNRYAMTDVNNAIEDQNTQFASTFDKLNGGVTAVLGLRTWASPDWLLSASWEPLRLETQSGTETVNLDANSFQFTAARFFPSSSKARYGIGAGLGYYSIAGKYEDTSAPANNENIGGTGIGFHALGLGEWPVNESFALSASAGYRAANIKPDANNVLPNTTDTANYSGVMARFGFSFYIPNK